MKPTFSNEDYDHAEHLAKVVSAMVNRAGPRFTADPKTYIAYHQLRVLGL